MRTYEIEDRTEYYNSYTDKIITGSMLPDGKRGVVGSVVSGSWEWQGETTYSAFAYKRSNDFFRSGMLNCSFGEVSNLYYNSSIPPDFRDITKINGGKFIAPKHDDAIVDFLAEPFNAKLLKIILSVRGAITGSDGATLSDNVWWYDYPFDYKYRNVRKLPQMSKAATTAEYEEYTDKLGRLQYRIVTEVTTSNKYVLTLTSGSNAVSNLVTWLSSYDKTGYWNGSSFVVDKTAGLSEADFSKIYFGYKANYVTILLDPTVSISQGIYGFNFGATCKGFKYGLMNATPLKKRIAFNRNHYGFRSDFLEAGLYGTMWSGEKEEIYKPISVTFVSGTRSAYSASNPHLNTNGSGIYDFEYRVSKPFNDVI